MIKVCRRILNVYSTLVHSFFSELLSDMILRFSRIGLMIEWFLVGIKLYGSIAFLRFFLTVLSHWMFHQSSSHCSLSELPLGFLSCAEPWIFKNTNGDISTTHYPCWKRRKLLGIGYSFIHLGTMTPLN